MHTAGSAASGDAVKKRNLRPHPPLSVAPIFISDETAHALIGLRARPFRELLAAHPEIPRLTVGRRVLVAADDFRRFATSANENHPSAGELRELGEDGPTTAAHVIALARRRSA